MAPKGTKRASTGGIEKAAKKAATSKCAAVVAELGKVEALPESCRTMLVSMAEPALTTYAAERHEFQVQGVDMVAKALAILETALESKIATEQVKVDTSDAEKAARAAALSAAETKFAELQQAATTAEETLEADTGAKDTAKDDLAKAQAALQENTSELTTDVEKKKNIENAKTLFEPLKATKVSGHEGRKTLNAITKVLKAFELEDLLVTTIGEAFHKEVAERSTFDGIVVEHVEKKLSEWTATVDSSISSGESRKAELTVAHRDAEQHFNTIVEKILASKTAIQTANTAVSEGKTALKEAEAAVKSFEKDMTTAGKKLEEAKGALENFKAGALKSFSELKELAPPAVPVPEEPVPEEEPAPTAQETAEFQVAD